MNDKLIDKGDKRPTKTIPIKESCCCFCCFCTKKSEDPNELKNFYIEKWRNYLSSEKEMKQLIDPFKILTDLWGHKTDMSNFYRTRINPNFLNEGFRNDLEFYVPQLCTFLIFGNVHAVEEFLAILCKACFASFFFAHKIMWFLESLKRVDEGRHKDK